jgi:hypothetical protein
MLSACGGGSTPGSGFSETPNPRVYIAGDYSDGTTFFGRAYYWTDKTSTLTALGAAGQYSRANALAVSAGHVYIAGYYNDGPIPAGANTRACYWMDNNTTPISLGVLGQCSALVVQ